MESKQPRAEFRFGLRVEAQAQALQPQVQVPWFEELQFEELQSEQLVGSLRVGQLQTLSPQPWVLRAPKQAQEWMSTQLSWWGLAQGLQRDDEVKR